MWSIDTHLEAGNDIRLGSSPTTPIGLNLEFHQGLHVANYCLRVQESEKINASLTDEGFFPSRLSILIAYKKSTDVAIYKYTFKLFLMNVLLIDRYEIGDL